MIRVELNQARLQGGQRYPARLLSRLLRAVGGQMGKREYDVSIAFVSPLEIRRANRMYRGKDSVTDVLSFALDDGTGELLLCYEQARRQAREVGHSAREEVSFLIVHGLLHLFGYDHERPSDARKMFAMQERILQNI
ncbi:rRNA maturation RNase YbeY [Candidatus Parcubacteria bacterium]|nr:rRNA maturation RNase YbeY [Candidatus Parcubacteria bacterium]